MPGTFQPRNKFLLYITCIAAKALRLKGNAADADVRRSGHGTTSSAPSCQRRYMTIRLLPGKKETMQKLIKNNWQREPGAPFERAQILRHDIHPEGLDVDRIRFIGAGRLAPEPRVGHIISVLKGSGVLLAADQVSQPLQVEEGVHIYLPPCRESALDVAPGTELLCVSGASAAQARGKKLLLRDETFLAACASGSQSLRWTFTSQYLSRRVFLHHDQVLLSRSGHPVSWFRTTMFDVAGLPPNEEGGPVFKMSYNSRTECNVCYNVQGNARVRMARHPYVQTKQLWGAWNRLDGDSTYHLNEAAGSAEEERHIDDRTGASRYFRNKHEVHIGEGGYVTLCCLFDPAPTGVERHQPGEYSDYEPLSQVIGTRAYEDHRREIAKYDEMLDNLSLAKAMGELSAFQGTPLWDRYLWGRDAQIVIESELAREIAEKGNGRARVLEPWMQRVTESV